MVRRIIHCDAAQDAMPAEERLIAFTCSYLPVTYKCMWDCHRMTLCSTQTYSSVDASALLTLATTCYTPITLCLCSYWSAKHFNPSLSLRPWRQPKMINQRQVSTQKQHLGCPACIHYPQSFMDVELNIGRVRILKRAAVSCRVWVKK